MNRHFPRIVVFSSILLAVVMGLHDQQKRSIEAPWDGTVKMVPIERYSCHTIDGERVWDVPCDAKEEKWAPTTKW